MAYYADVDFVFQSTLPVWGATVKKRIFYSNFQFFSV